MEKFLRENDIFWMKLLILIKQNKTERKSKFWNELANYLTENILLNKYLLLHKHPAIGYNFNICEWKNDNLMKLLHSFFI